MIFEQPRNDGDFVSGDPTGAGDVFQASIRQAWYAGNPLAERAALEDAYDKRIDEVFASTGQRLANPARMSAPRREAEPGEGLGLFPRLARRPIDAARDHFADFDQQLAKLAEQFPDARDRIKPDRSPREDARELARKAEAGADDALARYDGTFGLGTAASVAGGFVGSLRDPTTYLAMLAGPTGRVGLGAKELVWSAIKQGAANAAVEAAFQPNIAAWRKEAGLDYDIGTFATNVGGAALLGAGLDAGARGLIRGVQRQRGLVPKLDEQGGIAGWLTPEQAAEDAARVSKIELVRKAADGDIDALRTLANEQGIGTTPEIRHALDMLDDERATDPRRPGFDPDESDAAFMQALRAVADDDEPLPPRLEPLRREPPIVQFRRDAAAIETQLPPVPDGYTRLWRGNRPDEIGQNPSFTNDLAGIALPFRKMYDGELSYIDVPTDQLSRYVTTHAAAQNAEFMLPLELYSKAVHVPRSPIDVQIKRVLAGEGTALDAAIVLRERPDLADGTLSLASHQMQVARALARLSDEAFAAVLEGRADPSLAAIVGQYVRDKTRQAAVLEGLIRAEPESLDAARRFVAGMEQPEAPGRAEMYLGGLDDPTGPQAKAQTEALQEALSERIVRAEKRAGTNDDSILDVELRKGLAEADALERMAEVIELCKAS